jgi:hypothetical protein
MNEYLKGRLTDSAARLRYIANMVPGAKYSQDINSIVDMLQAQIMVFRIHQYEWQKQVWAGMKYDLSPQEVVDASHGGLVRIDL